MRALVARLGGVNLTKPWLCESSFVLQNGTKGFLSPLPTNLSLNRGAKVVDCGISWVRPVEPPCITKVKSGDLEDVPVLPPDLLVPELAKSEVWKKAPHDVQKLYTFAYLDRIRRRELIEDALKQRVRRHIYDELSPEAILARQTASIRRMQVHMETRPDDRKNKVALKELIEKRKKRLKNMRRCNYRLFEYILDRLNLVYYSPAPDTTRPMRSFAMIDIATNFCEELKAARLEKYREELEERKPEFLRRKAATMRAIIDDEKKLNIPPSFTEEEILEVDKLCAEKEEQLAKIVKPDEDIF